MIGLDVAEILACVFGLLPNEIANMFESTINGLIIGGKITLTIRPDVSETWNDDIESLCSGIFTDLNDLLDSY